MINKDKIAIIINELIDKLMVFSKSNISNEELQNKIACEVALYCDNNLDVELNFKQRKLIAASVFEELRHSSMKSFVIEIDYDASDKTLHISHENCPGVLIDKIFNKDALFYELSDYIDKYINANN